MQRTDVRQPSRDAPRLSGRAPAAGAPRPGDDPRLWRIAVAIVVAAAAVRLVMAAMTPLVPDEAYYWDWSRRLATGYFDHPPMIALMIAAGTALFGATPFGVRFVPVAASLATILLVVDLARRHGGTKAGLYAAVLTACVPLAAAGFVLATPDTPLLLACALVVAAVDRALSAAPQSRASYLWWSLAGVALGFGLASKYTAVLIPLGVLVAFLLRPELRRRLAAPEPYLAAAVALALFLPVVVWNARHEWASFAFQLQHGLGASGAGAVGRVLDLLGNQAVLVSPILFVLLLAATLRTVRRGSGDRAFLLAVVCLTTLGFFFYSAIRQRPEPNWPAPAYIPAFVLLAVAAAGGAWKRWMRAGCALGAAMVVLLYVQSLYPLLPVPPAKDPMARGAGWGTLADSVHVAARGIGQPGRVWVAANRYQDAAQLAFHLPGNPTVFSLNIAGRPNQYDFWPGFTDRARPGEALLVIHDEGARGEALMQPFRPHFETLRAGPLVELRRGDGLISVRRVWVLEGWRGGWPDEESTVFSLQSSGNKIPRDTPPVSRGTDEPSTDD
jgi:4-amino-4-deoxy-L-arabinose transferase-like glycosyltransferase